MSTQVHCAYYRVSKNRRGQSGLGLAAQQTAVHDYLKGSGGVLMQEFTEIESGRRCDRVELRSALELCRKHRCTLVIAKLDRLARNVAFVSALLESKVKFVAVDMPEASVTFLQMAAVFAEWEATRISDRTKAALAAAKARGQTFGWAHPTRRDGHAAASKRGAIANAQRALRFAGNVLPIVQSIRQSGSTTLSDIAQALNARGVATQRGGLWHAATVSRVLAYAPASGVNVITNV